MKSNPSNRVDTTRVTLPQGVIVGKVETAPDFPQAVECFLGFPYAQAPIGNLRFRNPVKLKDSTDTFEALEYGAAAPGEQLLTPRIKLHFSEDCLNANVFTPQSRHPGELLPVMVYIHGGAWNRGSSSMQNTASMVAWSEERFVGVSFNYRLGALGFLPSKKSKEEGICNLGLKDQILFLEWVQDNIHFFGGDKNRVTLMGLSAGGHSVAHHINRYNRGQPATFHAAIIESGSGFSRGLYAYDSPIWEEQFDDFLHEVECAGNLSAASTFEYLRSLPLQAITDAQLAVFKKWRPRMQWAFRPCVDGEVIVRSPLETAASRQYYNVPIMTGFTSNEGSVYADKNMSTSQEFRRYLRNLLPRFSETDLDYVEKLYPDPLGGEPKYKEQRPTFSAQSKGMEELWSHFALVAPIRQTASTVAVAEGAAPVYLFQLDIAQSLDYGCAHGDNLKYETFEHATTSLSPGIRDVSGMHHAYITSFICNNGDPNRLKGRFYYRPRWEPYSADTNKIMVFGRGNKELIGGDVGTPAELIDDTWAKEECDFWTQRIELTLH